jgi:hypothetical protein
MAQKIAQTAQLVEMNLRLDCIALSCVGLNSVRLYYSDPHPTSSLHPTSTPTPHSLSLSPSPSTAPPISPSLPPSLNPSSPLTHTPSIPLPSSYSTIGSDVRSTRLGYKNQQKVKAFELMAHLADNLAIHPSVIVRAKEE